MRPLSRTHCVIPLYSSTKPTSSTTTFSARFLHSTPSAHTSPLQPHIQTPKIHRLAVQSRTSLHPQTILPPSTRKSRISPAARSSQSPTPALSQRNPFSTTRFTMSSDDAYMSFLDKANADLNAGRAQQQGASETARTETVDANTKIPASLQSVDAYYVSDADEPFEPVALRWEGASKGVWPSAGTFFLHTDSRIDGPAVPCTVEGDVHDWAGGTGLNNLYKSLPTHLSTCLPPTACLSWIMEHD